MFKLEFTNARGESVELFSYPYLLYRFEGLGDVEAEHQTQKSYNQDGSTLVSTTLREKYPELELKITGKDEVDLAKNRRKLTRVFNPKLGSGQLKRVSKDGTHILHVVPEATPFYPDGTGNRGKNFQKSLIHLYAPKPYWESDRESRTDISLENALFEFPLDLVPEGIEMSERIISYLTNIYNEGDETTPVRIRLRSKGSVLNPMIENLDTGEYIKLNRSLEDGETLEINTEFGDKRVEIVSPNGDRINAFHYIDHRSTFFELNIGDNPIRYGADRGQEILDVTLYFTPRYLGV